MADKLTLTPITDEEIKKLEVTYKRHPGEDESTDEWAVNTMLLIAHAVRDAQLAHSQKEHEALIKEERRAIGAGLAASSVAYRRVFEFPTLEKYIKALKQGKLPEDKEGG